MRIDNAFKTKNVATNEMKEQPRDKLKGELSVCLAVHMRVIARGGRA